MSQKSKNLLQFLKLVGKLKKIPRTGWLLHGINNPESIAGHMHRMSIMALLLPESSGLDINKCIKLALVHDIAECVVGDLTPFCGVSQEEKHKREDEAMKGLSQLLGESSAMLTDVYQEYAAQETNEAKVVKEIDRLDMLIQAFEYESESSVNLQEFFDSTRGKFQNPWVLQLIQQLYLEREEQIKTKT